MLLLARYLLGFRGAALTNGLTLAGPRNTATLIENYLKDNEYSIVGPAGSASGAIDGLILMRMLQGVPDGVLLNGISLPAWATYTSPSAIRAGLAARCGYPAP